MAAQGVDPATGKTNTTTTAGYPKLAAATYHNLRVVYS